MRRSDAVFFLSGAAALVHQVAWGRMLARVLGSDSIGVAVVVSVFMAGLGIGALAIAPLARSSARPARLFALCEIAIGVWAALSPLLLERLGPVGALGARAGVAVLVLLPPTIAMGATFPLMGRLTGGRLTGGRAAEPGRGSLGSDAAEFYGANTLGAAAGALLACFALLPAVGLSGSLRHGAALNVLAAILAGAWLAPGAAAVPATSGAPALRAVAPALAIAAALGASSLALEVLLTRVVVEVTGTLTQAFAIVLAAYLTGIGAGSRFIAGALQAARPGVIAGALAGARPGGIARALSADRTGAPGARRAAQVLSLAALAAPILCFAGLLLARGQLGEADLFAGLKNRLPQGQSVVRLWAMFALIACFAASLPALAFGAALPAAAAALHEAAPAQGRERALARVYAWNTAGAVLGGLAAGFALLPLFGLRAGIALALAPALAAGLLAARASGRAVLLALAGLALGALALRPAAPRAGVDRLVLVHDRDATVLVEEKQVGEQRVRTLFVSGNAEASTAPVDLRLQYLLGAIPGLLHGQVRSALVVGLGTGMTAGSLAALPSLERLEVLEICRAMPEAARAFAEFNGGLLDDARVRVRVADGRHALARSSERWDLITADPIHPWTRGANDLYSLEHFQSMRAHLAPGGIASQWLPLYQLADEDARLVAATWCAAFPHASAWLTAYDLVLVGAAEPGLAERDLCGVALPPALGALLARGGVRSGTEIAALQAADDAALRAFAVGLGPMRDDRPVLEFRSPRHALGGYALEVLRWAGRDAFVAELPAPAQGRARELRGLLARFVDAAGAELGPAVDAYGRGLLALEPLP